MKFRPATPARRPTVLARAAQSLNAGDAGNTALLCRQGLRSRPADAGLWRLLGVALLRLGDISGSIDALRKAVAHAPGLALAHLNLGSAMRAAGHTDEALACFERAIELDPRLAAAHYNVGNTQLSARRLEASVLAFDAATRLAPDHFGAWFNRGHALKALGQLEEAAASYRQALRIQPGSGEAWWALADHKGVRLTEEDAAQMTSRREHPALSESSRVALEFALARAQEELGRYDEAFASLLSANRRQRNLVRYDSVAYEQQVDSVMSHFSDLRLARTEAADTGLCGRPGDAPIFIISMPRSGSTLVDQILSSHSRVTSTDEPDTMERLVQSLSAERHLEFPHCLVHASGEGGIAPWNLVAPNTRDTLARTYLAETRALVGDAERFTDKSLGNGLLVGLIATLLPHARFVLVERDPLDTGLSCWRQLFARGHAYSYDLAELGHRLRQHQRLAKHWQELMPERVLSLRYEDLVQDLESQARRLLDFCELDWQAQCLDFHQNPRAVLTASASQVRRPLYTTAIGRWQHYAAHLHGLQEALTASSAAP